MDNTETNSGFTEVSNETFSALTDNIKQAEVSSIFDGKSEEEKITGNTNTTRDGDKEETEGAKPTSPGTGKIVLGKYVKAPWVAKVIDRLVPTAISMSFKVAWYEIDKKGLKLEKDDYDILEEPIQEVLDYLVLDLKNPWNKLALALGFVYGAKILEKMETARKIPKRRKQEEEKPKQEASKSTEEIIDELSQGNTEWQQGFTDEQITLIKATRKRRNCSYEKAIEWLKNKGQLKEEIVL